MSVLGCALFLLVSILTYTSYSHPTYGAPAGSAVALDFAFRTTEAPLDAMGAALQKAGALEAEGKMTEAAEVMAGAMEAAAASIQARHRGKLTRQATSQKLAEARMSGVKQ